jgi:zinc transport system substrate-binding protein
MILHTLIRADHPGDDMRYTISILAASLLSTTALAEVPAVVTDISPVHSLVAMVMGDLGAQVLLLDQGADAHDFQLRPSQAAAVQGAGLVVWVGPEMSPWLDRVLDGMDNAAPQLALLAVPGTALLSYGEDAQEGDAHAEEDNDDHAKAEGAHAEEGHEDEGHDEDGETHSDTDPHAWLSPANAAVWVRAVAAELARLDPANAATYAANADQALARIDAVAKAAEAKLAPVKDRPIIMNHNAYAYFAQAFGLAAVGHIAAGDASAPGAAALRDVIASAQGKGAACVFPETNHAAGLAEQVAADAGARLGGPLDPEGAALAPGPDLWPALVEGMARTIADCLTRP